jgi:hypothetical protein
MPAYYQSFLGMTEEPPNPGKEIITSQGDICYSKKTNEERIASGNIPPFWDPSLFSPRGKGLSLQIARRMWQAPSQICANLERVERKWIFPKGIRFVS